MRVTSQITHQQLLQAIQQRTQGQAEASRALSSGLRVEHARQDPAAMAEVLRQQDAQSLLQTSDRIAGMLEGRLGQAEGQLDAFNDILLSARDRVIQAQSAGVNAEDRQILAEQIRAAATSVAALANSRNEDGRPLFGGTQAGALFSGGPGAWTLDGPAAPAQVELSPGQSLGLGVDARGLFADAAGTGDLVSALEALADQVALNPNDDPGKQARVAALDAGLIELDAALERTNRVRGQVGLDLQRLEGIRDANAARGLAIDSEISRLRDADVAAEATRLASESAALDAARTVFQRLQQQSLFNYLR
ncbi:MAG: flagellin [Oceanococcaceae bacterium]